MSVRAPVAKRLPRPAPPGQPRIWEAVVDGVGTLYTHGAVVRQGVRTYLIRISRPDRNETPVCEIRPDGTVVRWFFAWEENGGLRAPMNEARKFVLAHSVMDS